MKYGFEIIHMKELEKLMKEERVYLIDLRDKEKYNAFHLQGAKNFSLESIESWKKSIPQNVNIVLYCEHGNKSLIAAKQLRGRTGKIYTIFGGIGS